MSKLTEKGLLYVSVYVDDCLFIRNKHLIDQTIKELKQQGFTLKVDRDANDYLGC